MKDNNKKSLKRKFLAATLGALIVVNIVSVCDFSVVKFGGFSANLNNPDQITMSLEELDEETLTAVKNRIIEGLDNCEEEIPMTEYCISYEVAARLMEIVLAENPQYYYIGTNYYACGSYFRGNEDIIYATKIKIYYPLEQSEIESQRQFIDSCADEIISKTEGMSDLEKALYVHDQLALNYSYDTRVFSEDQDVRNQTNFRLYGFFEEKTGVCDAYSAAYTYILRKLGIPVKKVSSSSMQHSWNVIQIDGHWYHVDVTWDDPMPDRQGTVAHEYFLLSDAQIQSLPTSHHDWTFQYGEEVVCDDTTYDNYWWSNVSTEIFRINGKWFSINDEGEFLERDVQSGNVVQTSGNTFSIERDKWYAWNSDVNYWTGNYTTLINNGEEFFYNTTEDVYVINIDGSNKRLVANFPKEEHNGFQIYGLAVDENNMLYVNLQNNPQDVRDENGNIVQPMEVQKVVISDISTASSSAVEVDDDSNSGNGQTSVIDFVNWNEINDFIKENNSVEISVSDKNTELPSEVVENIKGKDLDIIIDMNSYQWIINGMDVSDEEIADVNLGVSENLGIVPDEVNDMYIDDQKAVEVNLDHEGQFGYNATLRIYVGKEYASQIASVFHYQPENNRLDYQESVTVDEDGYADLNLCHASSYMVVIDDKAVGLPGDIDADGNTNLKDYVMLKQYLVGKSSVEPVKLINTDMNGDGRISIGDAVILARQII